ncbi:hypothetical protein COU80_00120 [Candidatus Peregrinibacteria bacterium CG10_big_fil_rev_8_21_14_0_10_55_24]|nr:MAG: hypothetical protein COU80_00120 [Candidatus Peregrinibacteria bacterium CG10_big_fil_rev_8_21_14_0_10_55_24]
MPLRTAALWVFCLLLFAYAYASNADTINPNSRQALLTAIVTNGSFVIDTWQEKTIDKSSYEGHIYSDKAPGTALLALPAYAAARGVQMVTGWPGTERAWFFLGWMTTVGSVGLISAAGGCAFFLLLAERLSRRLALVATLAVFLGSSAFAYATSLFSHAATIGLLSIALWAVEAAPAQKSMRAPSRTLVWCFRDALFLALVKTMNVGTLLLIGAHPSHIALLFAGGTIAGVTLLMCWHSIVRDASTISTRDAVAGLACGFAICGEYTSALAAGVLLLLMVRRGWRRSVRMILAAAFPVALLLIYNTVAFGSPVSIGYAHVEGFAEMREGFFGIRSLPSISTINFLLFSEARGLLFWTPFFLLSVGGLLLTCKRSPTEFLLFFCLITLHIVLIAGYFLPSGGWALGPRHLAALVPFLGLLCARALPSAPKSGTLLAVLSILLTGTATCITNMPDENVLFPLQEIYWPSLLSGRFVETLRRYAGLDGALALLPLLLMLMPMTAWLLLQLGPAPRWRIPAFPRLHKAGGPYLVSGIEY